MISTEMPVPGRAAAWQSLLDQAFDRLLLLFLFITVFLPSGTVYGINLKLPLYAVLLPLAVYSFFARQRATPARLAAVLAFLALLAFWTGLGIAHNFSTAGAVRQSMDIVLTLLLCWLTILFCGADDEKRFRFLRWVLFSEVCASLLKAGMIVYALVFRIPVPQVVVAVSKIFGVSLMTMDLGALFGRVQFVSDVLIPVCLYLMLRHRDSLRIGPWRAAATVLLLVASVLFGFSRFFWAYSVLAFLLGLLLGRRDRFQLLMVAPSS